MERIDLSRVRHAERHRWVSGGEWYRHAPKIAIGELLGGGGWYVRRYDGPLIRWPRAGTLRYAGPDAQWYATRTAWRWMRTLGGEWVEA